MTLDQALSALDEEDPQALPAINRRHGVRRVALLLDGDDELVARLDEAFAVVSTHYWSVVEPSRRAVCDERLAHRSAEKEWAEQQQEAEGPRLLRAICEMNSERGIPATVSKAWRGGHRWPSISTQWV
jgi:hypothetical protein